MKLCGLWNYGLKDTDTYLGDYLLGYFDKGSNINNFCGSVTLKRDLDDSWRGHALSE